MKRAPVLIGIVVGGLILFLLYFFYSGKKNSYQWMPTLHHDSKQPYGTLFVKKMLESYRTGGKFTLNQKYPISKLIADNDYSKGETDLVFIGHSVYFDRNDIAALKKFLRDGNNVFIATEAPPENLIDSVYMNTCMASLRYDRRERESVDANFYHKNLWRTSDYNFTYKMFDQAMDYRWHFVTAPAICDSLINFTPLGYQEGNLVNFLKINFEGKGNLYLHTSPIMFTNYFMVQPEKVEYASAVFSHLTGRNMIWDEVSKLPFSSNDNPYESPLYFIMQQPALKYAWWLLLAGVILYIIFASKRTQRIIPVLEAKTNTSLEFLNVISSLHYQNPNHLDMARKKMKYFLYFIRARYGINTQTFTEDVAKRLAEKSKVDYADIQVIYDRFKVIESYSIAFDEPERLVGLYQAIEKFYKNCK